MIKLLARNVLSIFLRGSQTPQQVAIKFLEQGTSEKFIASEGSFKF